MSRCPQLASGYDEYPVLLASAGGDEGPVVLASRGQFPVIRGVCRAAEVIPHVAFTKFTIHINPSSKQMDAIVCIVFKKGRFLVSLRTGVRDFFCVGKRKLWTKTTTFSETLLLQYEILFRGSTFECKRMSVCVTVMTAI